MDTYTPTESGPRVGRREWTNHVAVGLWQRLGFRIVETVPEAFEHPALGRVGLHVMHRCV